MPRFLSPDDACKGVTVRGKRYGGTSFEVSDSTDARWLKSAGFTVADTSGAPSKAAGFECGECGFHSYFRLCSRCGAECERPDLVA